MTCVLNSRTMSMDRTGVEGTNKTVKSGVCLEEGRHGVADGVLIVDDRDHTPAVKRGARMRDRASHEVSGSEFAPGVDRDMGMLVVERDHARSVQSQRRFAGATRLDAGR